MDDDTQTGAAPAPAPAAPAAAPAPSGAPAAAPSPAPTALAASAPSGSPTAAPSAAGPNDWAPEKHRVFQADGTTLDLEATARKVAQAYSHAEKRIGSGDVPPDSAEGYKVNVPEALKDKINGEELSKSEDFKGFLAKMHTAGLSQSQLDLVAGEMLERGMKMREAQPVLDAAECTATLKQVDGWKTDQEYAQNMGRAFTAAKAYAGSEAELNEFLGKYGNDPVIARLLARVGSELAEDTQPSAEALGQLQQSLDQLMQDPAYLNAHDPKHAGLVERVNALTARMVGNKPAGQNNTRSFHS